MNISGKAKLAGVVGWPVSHSKSPRLHGYWLEKYKIDGLYMPLSVRPDHFARAFAALPLLGFRGVNITLPHKESALALVDEADSLARRIGAVNTAVVREDGRIYGANTDAMGFIDNVRDHQPQFDFSRNSALVLGAGGAARAVIAGLQEAGCPEILIANRSFERARALAGELSLPHAPIKTVEWSKAAQAMEKIGLLVNATQLGMAGQEQLPFGLDFLPEDAVVSDIVYEPLETQLLLQAKKRGNTAVGGLGMLLRQARPGFEAWFGVAPEIDDALKKRMIEK